jgi:NADPH:quinone reductase-like Zn-dependent oxidoreductase
VPVVASTAWQMVFDHGQADETKRVLVQGGAGNVGGYAVQPAKWAGAEVTATARAGDVDFVYTLGADRVVDTDTTRFEDQVGDFDVVVDTIGGEMLDRSCEVLKRGGVLVSAAGRPDQDKATQRGVRVVFFLVAVSPEGLMRMGEVFDSGRLKPHVGEVLALSDARLAHEGAIESFSLEEFDRTVAINVRADSSPRRRRSNRCRRQAGLSTSAVATPGACRRSTAGKADITVSGDYGAH